LAADVAVEPVRSRRLSRASLAQLAVVLGGVTVVVSLSLYWVDYTGPDLGVGESGARLSAIDVPVRFLFDSQKLVSISFEHPSILVGLIPAVVLGVLGAIFPIRTLVFVGAAVALVVPALFAYQLHLAVDADNKRLVRGVHLSLTDLLGPGAYACAIGAVVMIAGGWFLRSSEPLQSTGRDRLADDE
jgi:hypothetical protein